MESCKRVGTGTAVGVALAAGLLSVALAYGVAWASQKVRPVNSRGTLVALGLVQAVVGVGSGAALLAARRRLTDGVAIPAGAALVATGTSTAASTLWIASRMATPSSTPSTPPDAGA